MSFISVGKMSSLTCRTSIIFILISIFLFALLVVQRKKSNERPKIINETEAVDRSLRYFDSPNAFSTKYIPFLEELGIFGNQLEFIDLDKSIPNPVLVTAASSNHVREARNLTLRLAKQFPNLRLIIFDIGLKEEERNWFQTACNVDYRRLDIKHFGIDFQDQGNFNLDNWHGGYRWKPIVIAKALMDYPAVMWIDTSISFKANRTIEEFVKDVNPLQAARAPNHYLMLQTGHSVFATTYPETYSYLKPQRSHYQDSLDAAAQLVFRTKSTYNLSLKWLVLCALEKSCMAPNGIQLICDFKNNDRHTTFAGCHRFDQSAVNIVIGPYPSSVLSNTISQTILKLGGWESEEEAVVCNKFGRTIK